MVSPAAPAHHYRMVFCILLIMLLFISNGCSVYNHENNAAQSFVIDPDFQEFYDRLGGKQVLGEVISPAFVIQNSKYQYTVNGVLESDLLEEGEYKVKLSAIGNELNIDEHIEIAEGQISGPFLRDFIYPEFFQVYQYLGGLPVVGKPLTGVHYNPNLHRYEQYFENLGFYRLEKDTPGTVYLLAYGAWKCGKKCPAMQKSEAAIVVHGNIDPIFVAKVNQLGKGLTGFALTGGYQGEDGGYEQVFENVLLRVDMNQPSNITLAHLVQRLNIKPDPLEISNQDIDAQSKMAEAVNGYKVPQEFIDYLNDHGGIETSGNPIGRCKAINDHIHQQCFENLCLEMDTHITGIYRVRPIPIGYSYLDTLEVNLEATSEPPADVYSENIDGLSSQNLDISNEISLQVWEDYPFVTSSQPQRIGVMVYGNNQPLANVTPELMITMPDGSPKEYFFPVTDPNGKSHIQIEPTGAPNGTLILYQVCVSKTLQEKFCVQDNFLIWNNP